MPGLAQSIWPELLTPIFTKRIVPQSGVIRAGSGDVAAPPGVAIALHHAPSPVITVVPILTFFTTNYMGTGYVATPSTRAVNGGVIREKDEKSAGHPPAMQRPAARPDAKRLHNDVARRSSAAFPSVSRGRSLAAKIGANSRRSCSFASTGWRYSRGAIPRRMRRS